MLSSTARTIKPRLHWPIVGPTSRADDRPDNAISVNQPVAPPLDGYLRYLRNPLRHFCVCLHAAECTNGHHLQLLALLATTGVIDC